MMYTVCGRVSVVFKSAAILRRLLLCSTKMLDGIECCLIGVKNSEFFSVGGLIPDTIDVPGLLDL